MQDTHRHLFHPFPFEELISTFMDHLPYLHFVALFFFLFLKMVTFLQVTWYVFSPFFPNNIAKESSKLLGTCLSHQEVRTHMLFFAKFDTCRHVSQQQVPQQWQLSSKRSVLNPFTHLHSSDSRWMHPLTYYYRCNNYVFSEMQF